MSDAVSTSVPVSPAACARWGFWGSLVWSVVAVGAWIAVQAWLSATLLLSAGLDLSATPKEIDAVTSYGRIVGIVAIVGAPVPLVLIAIAVRLARCSLHEYLSLGWPDRREFGIGLASILGVLLLADLISYLLGQRLAPEFVTDVYRSSRGDGTLWLLAFAVAVAAPVVEETVFRGFLQPGLTPRIGAPAAVVLTSAGW